MRRAAEELAHNKTKPAKKGSESQLTETQGQLKVQLTSYSAPAHYAVTSFPPIHPFTVSFTNIGCDLIKEH